MSPTFSYLLINHVPFGRTSHAQRFQAGDMWLQDLHAQRAALERVGGRMVVACPLADTLDVKDSGSFGVRTIDPRDEGFGYEPLPFYNTFGGWLRSRAEARRRLQEIVPHSTVVHMGDGAHPIAIDEIAWPLAGRLSKLRVWVYDGADVVPRLVAHAESRGSALKRAIWRRMVKKREAFSRQAIREADIVFAHNAAVVQRFADVWDARCHVFDRSFVTEDTLIDDATWAEREARLLETRTPLRLVVAGRQIRIKGTDQILEAMARAARQGVVLELDVVGDGEDLAAFRAQANELGLGERVRFHGAVPYGRVLFELTSRAHAMVIANLTPEISRNVLLAMALGLPLIGYRNPGTDELIDGNDAGTLVPAADVGELCAAFVRLSRDRTTLVRHGRNGRAVAAKKTLEACHRERAELVAECAERRRTAKWKSRGVGT